jgi:hypothetical protein
MAFDTLTKAIRLLVGRRYTSTDLTDSQEAFASTIQIGSSEIWSQTNLIPSASLPYSSSATAGTTVTSGVIKYWYKWPLTVANNTVTGSSVWYFTSPTGSVAGIGSQLIDGGQQTNFISPKYISDSNIVNQSADADNNGNPPGYNIALFTSANGITFTPLSPSASYQFDYKSGILQFTTTTVPSNRIYATVYQYVGRMLSDPNDIIALSITASNISASGQITATGFSGSVYGTSSWSNNSLTASYFGSGSNNYFPIWTSNKLSYDSLISQSNNQIAILSDTASFLGDDLIINKSDPIYSNNNPTIDASNSPNQTLMLTPNVVIGGDGNSEHWNRFNSDGTVDFLGANIKFTSGGAAAFNSNVTIGSSTVLGNNTLDVIGNISAFAITASNISASGNTELNTLSVRGNTTLYGNFTVYGTGSVVNISSSTVIIGDNRIQLNAWSTGSLSQRYAGLDLTDSGSNNNVTSSLLWDSANNYWLLTNNQTGSNPVVTSSALILQGPISSFGNEKQLPINTFLKVESAIGNLTASNLTEVDSLLTYNGTISSSAISASSAFFNLDVLIGGVLKVFNKIYAYAGIIGDVTGSLSGSSVIANTITASTISSSTLISNNNTLVNITSSNISASGYVSGSSANFTNLSSINNILTYVTSSNISASGNITGSNVYVENTITADTGSFIYLNLNNTGSAPTSYTDTGMPGEIRIDNNFIYIYTNNVWVRTPIVRWTT